MRILLIDDEVSVRDTLRRILEVEGHHVTTLPNGNDVLRGRLDADILITDLVMPGIEGLETIRHTRQNYPDIGIIAMSGNANIPKETYLSYAAQFGADHILAKPFYPRDLLAAVHEVAKTRQLMDDSTQYQSAKPAHLPEGGDGWPVTVI